MNDFMNELMNLAEQNMVTFLCRLTVSYRTILFIL